MTMREFFQNEMETLYIRTGLRQHFTITEMKDNKAVFKMLFDELEKVCAWFTLIPDADKQTIIQERMITDGDFQGFNGKIVWKWLNERNPKYMPDQSKFVDNIKPEEIASPEIAQKYIEVFKENLSKIGTTQARPDGIKDHRIQQLKDSFATIECRHVNHLNGKCFDCGSHKIDPNAKHKFVIEGKEIMASNEEEAKVIYHLRNPSGEAATPEKQ